MARFVSLFCVIFFVGVVQAHPFTDIQEDLTKTFKALDNKLISVKETVGAKVDTVTEEIRKRVDDEVNGLKYDALDFVSDKWNLDENDKACNTTILRRIVNNTFDLMKRCTNKVINDTVTDARSVLDTGSQLSGDLSIIRHKIMSCASKDTIIENKNNCIEEASDSAAVLSGRVTEVIQTVKEALRNITDSKFKIKQCVSIEQIPVMEKTFRASLYCLYKNKSDSKENSEKKVEELTNGFKKQISEGIKDSHLGVDRAFKGATSVISKMYEGLDNILYFVKNRISSVVERLTLFKKSITNNVYSTLYSSVIGMQEKYCEYCFDCGICPWCDHCY